MHVRSVKILTLALAPALVAAAVACSSGNNNKNNTGNANANTNTNSAANTAATRVATAAVTPAAPATRPATATAALAASPVRTATPAAASPTRAATASGAGTAAAAGSPAAGGAATDAALQRQLTGALLKEADLPQGFTAQGPPETDVTLPGQTADASITFTKIGQGASGLDIQALVIGLGGFKDTTSAQTQFAGVQQEINNASGGADFTLTPVPNAPKIGDQSQAFMVSGSSQGFNLNGYAIVWQHGKVDAFLVQVGVTQIDQNQVTQLAQKQDAALKAAGV
jgi:hypothetical protein